MSDPSSKRSGVTPPSETTIVPSSAARTARVKVRPKGQEDSPAPRLELSLTPPPPFAWSPGPVDEADSSRSAQERILAIVNSAEAKCRRRLAHFIALHTEVPAEVARAILANAPQRDDRTFAERMREVPQPRVGPGWDGPGGSDAERQSMFDAHTEAFINGWRR